MAAASFALTNLNFKGTKMKFFKSRALKITALILVLVILVSSIFFIRSCSAPPKYEEIEQRFKQLIADAHEVNVILFGDGLPTYERVSDPRDSVSVYNTGEFYTDKNGNDTQRKVWYYYTLDKEKTVVGFRDSYLEQFSYAYVAHSEQTAEQLAALFPAIEGATAPEGKSFYCELYRSKDGKDISYLVPYVEPECEFYYTQQDPADYDFVRNDSPYRTVSEMKSLIEGVYSRNYALSLYSSLFDGVASGDMVLKARYIEHTRDGVPMLAQSNTYESLFSERRVYKFETAKILKWGSNSKLVRIEIQSYLPSAPDKIITDEVSLVRQGNTWFLDSPTF